MFLQTRFAPPPPHLYINLFIHGQNKNHGCSQGWLRGSSCTVIITIFELHIIDPPPPPRCALTPSAPGLEHLPPDYCYVNGENIGQGVV